MTQRITNLKDKTVKLSEKNLGETFSGFRTRNNSLNNTLKAFTIKKSGTIGLMKIRNFCSSKTP